MWLLIDGNAELDFADRYVVFEARKDCIEEANKRGWKDPGMGIITKPGMLNVCRYGEVDLGLMHIEPKRCSICKFGTPMENALLPCNH